MPGYILTVPKELRPSKAHGMRPFADQLGFLDFIRELRHEDLPFPRGASLRVEGLEEALYAAKPSYDAAAAKIRHWLKAAANDLDRNAITVQVIVRDSLERGDRLWAVYRGERLPIHLIFNSPTSEEYQGSVVYRASFNLT